MKATYSPRSKRAPPRSFAHRGGAQCWPENTLLAFTESERLGVDFIETDARVTACGRLVLHHDATLERTTNGRGRLDAHTLAELKTLDAAYHFRPPGEASPILRGQGHRIPTPDELAEVCRRASFNVELKAGRETPELLFRWIERHQLRDRVIVAASNHSLMRRFRSIAGRRVPTSATRREIVQYLMATRLGLSRLVSPGYFALQIPTHHGAMRFDTNRFIEQAHRLGVQVHYWTINGQPEMQRLCDLGADGLMTDHPARLLETLSAYGDALKSRPPRVDDEPT